MTEMAPTETNDEDFNLVEYQIEQAANLPPEVRTYLEALAASDDPDALIDALNGMAEVISHNDQGVSLGITQG